jgi:hypothetical protein
LLTADGTLAVHGPQTGRLGDLRPSPVTTCWLAQRRLALGDVAGAARALLAIVHKRDFDWASALYYMPGDWRSVVAPATRRSAHTHAAAEFVLTLAQMLIGAQPVDRGTESDLLVEPRLPDDWQQCRLQNIPDPTGAFDLRLQRTTQGVTVGAMRRRGGPLRLAVRDANRLPDAATRTLVLRRNEPAAMTLALPPRVPLARLLPDEALPLPTGPSELVDRILGAAAASKYLANRDLSEQILRQTVPASGDVGARCLSLEAARREWERRFEAGRTIGR